MRHTEGTMEAIMPHGIMAGIMGQGIIMDQDTIIVAIMPHDTTTVGTMEAAVITAEDTTADMVVVGFIFASDPKPGWFRQIC